MYQCLESLLLLPTLLLDMYRFLLHWKEQAAAGIRSKEYPSTLGTGAHQQASIQNPLTVIDECGAQGITYYGALKRKLPAGIPDLQLGVRPMVPYRKNRPLPFPVDYIHQR